MFSDRKNQTQQINNLIKKTQPELKKRNFSFVNVGWDDCSRGYGSSIGPNISDWSFQLKNGEILPFIRGPNYQDKTMTMRAKDIAIVVGNENSKGQLYPINFQQYLSNYGKYTSGVPDDTNLQASENELVTIRFISVIVPEDKYGTCELVPTSYNYQTKDRKDPKNIIGASFHLGTGSRTDGPKSEGVYLVKTHSNGFQENTYFRITNENKESDDQKKATKSCLGTRSTGLGRNRVMCFQIPRKQKKKVQYRGAPPNKIYRCRGISKGNVSYGSSAGEHQMVNGIEYERDKTQNVTLTFAYYYTLPQSGEFTESEINDIMDTIDKSYTDIKSEWTGSLVTGEGVDKFKEKKPLIVLPEIKEEDYLTYNQKVTQFPKDPSSFFVFPS